MKIHPQGYLTNILFDDPDEATGCVVLLRMQGVRDLKLNLSQNHGDSILLKSSDLEQVKLTEDELEGDECK
jgi:hypothetical protein